MYKLEAKNRGPKWTGMTPVDIAIAVGVVAVVGGLLYWAVSSQQRLARDTQRLETTRTLQAAIELYRGQRASYPASLDAVVSNHPGYTYAATPEGCSEDAATLCTGYTLGFQLEGAVGGLAGGRCMTGPKGVTCAK